MSKVALLVDAQEYQALVERVDFLAKEVVELRTAPAANPYQVLSPGDVGKRYNIAIDKVRSALARGELTASKKPGRGVSGFAWEILTEDAHRWFLKFIRGQSNQ